MMIDDIKNIILDKINHELQEISMCCSMDKAVKTSIVIKNLAEAYKNLTNEVKDESSNQIC